MMTDSWLVTMGHKRIIHGWLCVFKSFSHASEGKTTNTTDSYEAYVLMHTDCT